MRFAADENFDNDILRGVDRRRPGLDVVTVQDAGLAGAPDPSVLAWAADEERVPPTHDLGTMSDHAYHRLTEGLPMSGVFLIGKHISIRRAIEAILLASEAGWEAEWNGRVRYVEQR